MIIIAEKRARLLASLVRAILIVGFQVRLMNLAVGMFRRPSLRSMSSSSNVMFSVLQQLAQRVQSTI
ncbi:MAG: hypothetical protein ACKVII_28570 [Planctomycetales bacterium]